MDNGSDTTTIVGLSSYDFEPALPLTLLPAPGVVAIDPLPAPGPVISISDSVLNADVEMNWVMAAAAAAAAEDDVDDEDDVDEVEVSILEVGPAIADAGAGGDVVADNGGPVAND